jgi:hypothetical protein
MKKREYNQMMKYLLRPKDKNLLKYIENVKNEDPATMKAIAEYNPKLAKKPKPIKPPVYDWKLGDWTDLLDEDYIPPEPDPESKIRRNDTGIVTLLRYRNF